MYGKPCVVYQATTGMGCLRLSRVLACSGGVTVAVNGSKEGPANVTFADIPFNSVSAALLS